MPGVGFIRKKLNAESVVPINKGFSRDAKYVVDDKYLLRLFINENIDKRRKEFDLIVNASTYSDYVPKGVEFNSLDDTDMSYMLLAYLPGNDAECELKYLTKNDQYISGRSAGKELKKLHRISAPRNYPSWYATKKVKTEKQLSRLKDINLSEDVKVLLDNYIRSRQSLMKGRSNKFQHDDFHPSNILIKNGLFSGIIDFQRMDWGDPFHDLHKLGFFSKPISIPFTKGIIDGYHGHNIPDLFWKLYSLYSAIHIVSALIWGAKRGPEQYQKLLNHSFEVLEDHDYFQNTIPKWYTGTY